MQVSAGETMSVLGLLLFLDLKAMSQIKIMTTVFRVGMAQEESCKYHWSETKIVEIRVYANYVESYLDIMQKLYQKSSWFV